MISPNVNFNLSHAVLIFAGAIVLSYFSNIGWWSLVGLTYLVYDKAPYPVLSYIALSLSCIFFFVSVFNMGWSF